MENKNFEVIVTYVQDRVECEKKYNYTTFSAENAASYAKLDFKEEFPELEIYSVYAMKKNGKSNSK